MISTRKRRSRLEGLRTISTLLTIWPSSSSTSLWRRDAVRVPVTWAVAVRPKAAPARAANAKRYSPGWVKWLPGPLTLTIETATYALCPSHLAGLEIEVNGKFLDHFVLDPASVHAYTVQPGDQIRVKGRLRLVNGAVRCIRFGQVTYTIRLTNPQQ